MYFIIFTIMSYSKIFNKDNIYNTFLKCKRGVSWKKSVQLYRFNLLEKVNDIYSVLNEDKELKLSRKTFTIKERGKTRLITNIGIEERVIQKILCDDLLLPILKPTLIYDNYASMKNRGLHFAKKRVSVFLMKYYRQNKTNEGYVLNIDFKKYFDSIDHSILLQKLKNKIKDQKILLLIDKLIYNKDRCGLNLGSQLSQVFAVWYLNELDHFIKEKLKIKYYGRYMDDLILIHPDKEYLKYCLSEIEKICKRLKVNINYKKTQIKKLTSFTFIKVRYSLKKSGKIVRYILKKNYLRLKKRLKKFYKLLKNNKIGYKEFYQFFLAIKNYFVYFNAYHKYIKLKKLYINYLEV